MSNLLFNVIRFDMQYLRFIEEISHTIINEEIIIPIKSEMKKFNYSEKIIEKTIIDNLIVSDDGFVQFDVISNYETESGFDVSAAREKGTKTHFIKPKVKLALSWIIGGFVKGFSKGHWVRGITKSNIIEKTIELRFPIAQERISQESILFFNKMVSA